MAKIMDPILPIYIYILSVLKYWAIVLGSFGGPGIYLYIYIHIYACIHTTYIYIYIINM